MRTSWRAQVHEYTREVLARLSARGLLPYMVQVGNEINTQMLRPAETKGVPIDWARNAKILNAGMRAVREAVPPMALAARDAARRAARECRAVVRGGGRGRGARLRLHRRELLPEVVGAGPEAGGARARRGRKRFSRPMIVVEVSYPFTLRDAGDKAPNLLGEDSLHRGYPATLRGQQRFMNDVVQ